MTSVADRGNLPEDVLAERLLLAIYAYGTNTGIRAVASGAHGHGEDDIRYARRRYLSAERARRIAIDIANATFAAPRMSCGAPAPLPSPRTPRSDVQLGCTPDEHTRQGVGYGCG